MPNNQMNRRFAEIMLGLLMLMFGLSAIGDFAPMALILGAIGFFLLARQFGQTSIDIGTTPGVRSEADDDVRIYEPRHDQIYAHALDAVQAAGLEPTETQVLPVDIGLMAFSGGEPPAIHRTRPVDDDVDYIQPFVQLRVPMRATGRIRFEILDASGKTMFVHEDVHQLQRGRNLISPTARLPIHDAHDMERHWALHISADGVLIASHPIVWQESTTRAMRRHVREDGELSNEIRAMLSDSALDRMSLDELLSDQAEEEAARRSGRRG